MDNDSPNSDSMLVLDSTRKDRLNANPFGTFRRPVSHSPRPLGTGYQPSMSAHMQEHFASMAASNPASKSINNNDQAVFEHAIQTLKSEIASAGTHFIIDASARQAYAQQIEAMAENLRNEASSGRITWLEAATQAQETRNSIMEIIRDRSTPVGRAMAEQLKSEGKTFNELIARYAIRLYGPNVNFNSLSSIQKNAVYAEIVKAAGRSNPRVTTMMRGLSRAGRGLIILSIALSVYTIVTADDKVKAAKREAAVAGAGIGGSILGGAAAGLVCGPGAPVCSTVGAFIGGALAAFGTDYFW